MADTTTTNLSLIKPEIGGAEDTWGVSINSDLDTIDAIFSATGTAVSLNIDGGDIASAVTINKSPVITLGGDLSGNVTLTNLASGTLTATVGTLNQSTTGNAATATALATGRNFSLTGNVTASAVSFDGTGNIALATTLADSTVTSAKLSGALTTPSDLTVGGAFTSQGIDDNADATAITIDSSENVGIGTTSPDRLFHVKGSAATVAKFASTGNAVYIELNAADQVGGDAGYIAYNNTKDMGFWTDDTERMRITSSGNVGIGTTSPASDLHISATGEARLILEGDSDNDSGEESALIEFRTDGGAVRHRIEATGTGGNDLKITAGADQTTNTLNSEIIFETKTANSSTAERMKIDADGNVGIGVSSIVRQPLQVHRASTSDVQIHMTNSATGSTASDGMTIFSNSTTSGFWQRESANMLFATASSERMRITPFGEAVIGQTTAFTTGSNNAGSGSLHVANNNLTVLYLMRAGSNGGIVSFLRGGISSPVGNISITTTGTSFNTSSDYRLKENVNYQFDALSRVAQLKPARFNFISDADTTVDGFLAHEVSDIVPEAITGEKDAVDDNGNPDYQYIDQSKLVPLLTKAIQEQQAIIEDLQQQINEVKNGN